MSCSAMIHTAAEYAKNGDYLGATIGRVGNRIGKAEFSLNGKTYVLDKNDGENHLHGGKEGFDKKIWRMAAQGESLLCWRTSPDGEENYPGNLKGQVLFQLTEDNRFCITYDADTDADTLVNLTNHSYFNLNGGGSVLDSVKCIGYGAANKGDVWDFYCRKRKAEGCLPIGCVLTIAATGSEMSDSSVITNEDGMIKRGYSSDYGRCRFAVMNPELTCTLPDWQTMSGCTDILMHTMERYFTKTPDTMLMDGMSESLMRTVIQNAKILHENPADYDARAQVMWAGSLAHNGLLGCGNQTDWASHQLEHELSGMFDVTHGAGLAAVWPSWARYVLSEKPARFAQFAVNVMGVTGDCTDPVKTALEGIREMERFFHEIGMPVNIHELGYDLTDEQIKELAYKCSFFGTRRIGGFKILDQEEMVRIYEAARGI